MHRYRTATAIQMLCGDKSRKLLSHSRYLTDIDEIIKKHLPAPLNAQCTVANLQEGRLVLAARTPAWAARLRYQAPMLLKYLTINKSIRIQSIIVKVVPDAAAGPFRATGSHPPRMSAENATMIRQTARAMSDSVLSAALERLATRGEEAKDREW